jgi:hypothetical protein
MEWERTKSIRLRAEVNFIWSLPAAIRYNGENDEFEEGRQETERTCHVKLSSIVCWLMLVRKEAGARLWSTK